MIDNTTDEVKEPDWAEDKKALQLSVEELSKLSQGTTMQLMLPIQLLTIHLDVCVDMMCTQGLIERRVFLQQVKKHVDAMASEVRRAILSASAPTSIRRT